MKCSQRYTVYGENGASNIYQSLQSDILLVDDNAVDAQIFQSALRQGSSRAQVYWVASGEEALDFLRQRRRFENVGPVKIVVLDLHLPGHDGFEILRQIKSDPSLSRIPVIMFTSGTAQNEIDLAYSLGANAYFKKPATLETCETVDEWFVGLTFHDWGADYIPDER